MTKTRHNADHTGAEQSIAEVFVENWNALGSYLQRFLHSRHDIEDVLQDAYISAVQAENSSEIRQPKAFLYKVCKNLALNHHNSAARRLTEYIADFETVNVIDNTSSPDEQLEQRNRYSLFCSSIKLLPPQCRRVFVLKKVYCLSNKEIAQRLGISVSTVDKHLGHGLKFCRSYLEKHGYGFEKINRGGLGKQRLN